MINATRETIQVVKQKDRSNVRERSIAQRLAAGVKDISQILAVNTSDIIIRIQLQPKFRLKHISPNCLQVFGYSTEEFNHDTGLILRSIHPEDVSAYGEFLKPTTDFGHRPVTIRWIRKDGRIVWTEQSKTVIRNKTGVPQELCFIARDVTERALAEEKLQESRNFVNSLMENAPHACMVINPDTSIRYVNPAWEEKNGWTLDEVVGLKAPYPWWTPEDRDAVNANFHKVMEEKGSAEVVAVKKNGERYWLSTNWLPVRHHDELQYLLINSIDITERKLSEEALKESEDKFARAFHACPDAICISTLEEGRLIDVNESLLKSLGYTREEIIGRTSLELNIWGIQDYTRIRKMLEKHRHIRGEQFEFITKSGDTRFGLLSAEIITISNKPCMLSVVSDITERKKVVERLRLVSSVTQQVSDATIVLNLDLNIIYLNQAAERMFGYSSEEVMGKSMAIFSASPVPKEKIRKILDLVQSGKVWSGEAQKKKKDGTVITSKIVICPLYDEDGRIVSYIDVEHDITEQKAMKARLQDQNNLVESILAAMPEGVLVIDGNEKIILANQAFHKIFHIGKKAIRHKSLDTIIPKEKMSSLFVGILLGQTTNNTLEFRYEVKSVEKIISCNATKMGGDRFLLTFTDISQERDEEEKLYLTDRLASLGEMAAGLAHELNNPLTGILALSQLLANNPPAEDHKEDLQSIFNEAKRAAEIVKNVLLFSRNNNLISGQAYARQVISEVLRLRQYEHKSASIGVATDFHEDLSGIAIDKYQLQQVCLNIILNAESAIKETDKPGTITIKTEKAGNFIVMSFTDTGCGIKKHVLPRIFDPFFTTKDIGKGTGLGLSICYGIVAKHGGKINVRTRVNEGSTFTVRLPVAP